MHLRLKGFVLLAAVILAVFSIGLCAAASSVQKEVSSSSSNETYYLLKDYNGTLAIFSSNQVEPIARLDVRTDSLPERDITRLQEGIRADTLEEIYSLAEDYE